MSKQLSLVGMEEPAPGSLAAARRELMAEGRWKGVVCPCCDQLAKVYARPLHSSMAAALIRIAQAPEGWVVITEVLTHRQLGDAAKLVYWGMLEAREGEREDGSSRVGQYRVTERGRAFVACRLAVPKYAVVYAGEVLRLEGDEITVRDALGRRFSYEALMNTVL
jgi:hypothetical protein